MKVFILDTNFAMVPFQYKIDILSEIDRLSKGPYKILIPSMALNELSAIAGGKTKAAPYAAAALKWIKGKIDERKITIVIILGPVDKWILKEAKKGTHVVCTNDKELRKNLKKKGIKTIVVRGRKKLFYS